MEEKNTSFTKINIINQTTGFSNPSILNQNWILLQKPFKNPSQRESIYLGPPISLKFPTLLPSLSTRKLTILSADKCDALSLIKKQNTSIKKQVIRIRIYQEWQRLKRLEILSDLMKCLVKTFIPVIFTENNIFPNQLQI